MEPIDQGLARRVELYTQAEENWRKARGQQEILEKAEAAAISCAKRAREWVAHCEDEFHKTENDLFNYQRGG